MPNVAFDAVALGVENWNNALYSFACFGFVVGFGLEFKDGVTIFVFFGAEACTCPFFTFEFAGAFGGFKFGFKLLQ